MTYSARIEERQLISPIHFINSLPGAGKTTAALQTAKETLHNSKHCNYVLVYAAPTIRLLKQFRRDLAKLATPLQMTRVHLVESQDERPAVAVQFHGLLNGYADADTAYAAVSNGSIILVTHECLRLTSLNMSGKERVSLIFDEARKCMQTNNRMRLPVKVFDHIRRNCILVAEPLDKNPFIARWTWIPGVRLDEFQLRKMWHKPSRLAMNACLRFIEALRSTSQDVWVEIDTSDPEATTELEISVMLSPSRLFANYGKVLIMSAFFQHSQMYHMLRKRELDPKVAKDLRKARVRAPEDMVRLVDITHEVIDMRRVRNIIQRRQTKMTLSYVFEDESLSKIHLMRGIVVPYKAKHELLDFYGEYIRIYESENNDGKPGNLRLFLKKVRSPKGSIRTESLARRDLLLGMEPSVHSVVKFLCLRARDLQRAWLAHNGMAAENLLIGVNSKASSGDNISLVEKEELDKLEGLEFLSIASRGINDYKHLNTVAFLATTKMSQREKMFLKALIPEYNSVLDRTVDQCVQFMFRTSVRVAESRSKTLVIVSDKKLAYEVNGLLGEHAAIVSPESIICKWKRGSIAMLTNFDPEAKAAADKAYQQTAKYKESRKRYDREISTHPYRVEYRNLSQRIARRSKRLKNNPDEAVELKAEIAALLLQRSNLKKD